MRLVQVLGVVMQPFGATTIRRREGDHDPGATSKANMQNAGFGMQLIGQLHADVSDRLEICILTPCAAQAQLYRSCIRIMGWDESRIEARTVDGYQACERSIVILDLVFVSRIGFMNDLHRLTVALSRHRDCLLVVGHVRSIASARPRAAKKLTTMTRTKLQVRPSTTKGTASKKARKSISADTPRTLTPFEHRMLDGTNLTAVKPATFTKITAEELEAASRAAQLGAPLTACCPIRTSHHGSV